MMWLAAFMLAPAPAEPPCNAATATRVSVERLAADPGSWIDRCVTVSGPAWGQSLYDGIGGLYLARRWRGAWRHRIGLYRYRDDEEVEGVREVTVTGTVDACERIAAGAEAENAVEQARLDAEGKGERVITMLTGYCHYHGGARRRYGSLAVEPSDWAPLGRARRLAAEIRDALATGDRQRLSALSGEFGADDEDLVYLFDRPDSPFRELRDPRRRASIAVLVEETDHDGRPLQRRTDFNAFLCFCRKGDCDGLWPIVGFDTWNRLDKPYACIESEEDDTGARYLDVRIDEAPLAEPERTAFPAGSSD
jgi:hypothetical protein